MSIILELIASSIMVLAFGILFQAPQKSLWLLPLIGVISWGSFIIAKIFTNVIVAVFISSIIIGICSELFARLNKSPATVFIIPGIIPLVPGVPAYNTMLYLIKEEYLEGIKTGIDTLLIGGAIAFAIAITGTAARYYNKWR